MLCLRTSRLGDAPEITESILQSNHGVRSTWYCICRASSRKHVTPSQDEPMPPKVFGSLIRVPGWCIIMSSLVGYTGGNNITIVDDLSLMTYEALFAQDRVLTCTYRLLPCNSRLSFRPSGAKSHSVVDRFSHDRQRSKLAQLQQTKYFPLKKPSSSTFAADCFIQTTTSPSCKPFHTASSAMFACTR